MGYAIEINERVRSYLAAAEAGLEDRLRAALAEIGPASEALRDKYTLDSKGLVRLYLFLGQHRFDYEIDAARQRVTVLTGFARGDRPAA